MFKTGVITDEISQDLQVAADLAVKYGLTGVELRSVWGKAAPQHLTDEDIQKIKEILKASNLETCGISAPFFKCDIDNESEIKEQYSILDKCVHLAQELGAPYVRGFTFWSKGDFDAYFDRIVAHLQDAAKHIEDTGITLVIEMDPSVFACDAVKVMRVVKAVDRPNVKALFDPGNLIWNPDHETPYPDAYELLKPYFVHVHIKDAKVIDGKADAVRVGDGEVGFDKLLQRLKDDGYSGYIVLETHYRKAKELSEELLARPGGAEFSDGAYEATEESLISLTELIKGLK